ncbi:14-3-3 protein [Histomonas meleagridis]|uniref:14-3-3 protein n=1 Tax=Histomonas meleagridis TaxID=135588 RepID=UPI003559F214|nr:14-3-3 protein [Histomonas meleagridis]KAH0804223.1 14-3-3 protein [Histomonas meleagridis]
MSTEKELCFYMAHVYDHTDQHQETIDLIKKAVDLDPKLSVNERNLLASAYKNLISNHRNGLRTLDAISNHDDGNLTESRKNQIIEIQKKISLELEEKCYELIKMVEEKLLPAAQDEDFKLFYEKLRGDYYRYICETLTGEEQVKVAQKAKEAYDSALEIAMDHFAIYDPHRLSTVLNYSIFLFEVMNQKEEAIDFAKNAYHQALSLIDENTDDNYSDATMILQMMNENINKWSEIVSQYK